MTPASPGATLADPNEPPRRPLLVTDHAGLLDDLLRVAAAADVAVDVAPDAHLARRAWGRAPLILVGADQAHACMRADLPRRGGVVLVGIDLDDAEVWERAMRIGADRVIFLPDAEVWLVDALADATDPVGRRSVVIAVAGGRGGAGATSLAVAMAMAGRRRDLRTVLIDADPLGGGIDLALGAEDASGLRWADLSSTRGRVPPRALSEALPQVDGVSLLSWDRTEAPPVAPEAMSALLSSVRRGSDLVVVDLPRAPDEAARIAISLSTVALVVVPAEVRATAAAIRVAALIVPHCADVRAVVRQPGPATLAATTVADAVGLPLAGVIRPEPGLSESLERGEPPGTRRRGPLARFCARFLAELNVSADGVAA
ncbi:MAG: septum site-determining protein Ssd [Frankia sp.]